MTESERQQLKQFEARVRQLLLQYKTLQAENQQYLAQINELQVNVGDLTQRLATLQHDYQTLKTARMIEISDGDMKNAKQTISLLVREVNKCIGLLSAEQFVSNDDIQPILQQPIEEQPASQQPDENGQIDGKGELEPISDMPQIELGELFSMQDMQQ